MARVTRLGPLRMDLDAVDAAERFHVAFVDLGAAREEALDLLDLLHENRRVDIVHVVFPAEHVDVVPFEMIRVALEGALVQSVKAELFQEFRLRRVARRDRAPLARGDVLRGVEAEAGEVAVGSRFLPVPFGLERVSRVLDDGESARPRDIANRRHVAHLPVEVHREDGSRAIRDRGLDRGRIDVRRRGIDVGEHRRRTGHDDAVRRSDEGGGSRDDLVSRPDSGGQERELHRGRTARHRDGGREAEIGGETLFELADLVPRRQEEGAEDALDAPELFLADIMLAVLDLSLQRASSPGTVVIAGTGSCGSVRTCPP